MTHSRPRALIYAQHLLGVGHLVRAGRIATALVEHGFDVTLVSGGTPMPGFDVSPAKLVQLLPLRAADTRYASLITVNGRPPSDSELAERRDTLLSLFARQRPDILILEHYPLGRRKFAFELTPLLDAAYTTSPRPKIICSVRDFLVLPKKEGRAEEITDQLNARFDAVFVHGDPRISRLSDQLPTLKRFAGQMHYTGYIMPAAKLKPMRGRDIVFSLGSGTFGRDLIEIGIAASRLSRFGQTHRWRFLAGAADVNLDVQKPNITIETWQQDFSHLVFEAALSVSQGGYNTMIETVAAETPSIIVPYEADGQTEQRDRAEVFEKLNLIRMLTRETLTPDLLAQTIDETLEHPPHPDFRPDLDGLSKTVAGIKELIASA